MLIFIVFFEVSVISSFQSEIILTSVQPKATEVKEADFKRKPWLLRVQRHLAMKHIQEQKQVA